MAIITFWNNGKGETGQTTSMAALATQMSLENNYKILIINTKYNNKAIEDCFWNNFETAGKLNFREEGKTDLERRN